MEPNVPVEWPDYDSGSERWNGVNRFPEQAVGFREWLRLREVGSVADAFRWLDDLQALVRPPHLCPRIFISHRQSDRMLALQMARIVSQCGFYFWLDILDAQLLHLSGLAPSIPVGIAMAGVIEMALLNCTHVIVLRTPQSKGSAWIPYEYGRVKAKKLHSDQAGAWIHPMVANIDIEEYFYLGVIHQSKGTLQSWLNYEFSRSPGCSKRYPVEWDEVSDDLPSPESTANGC